MVTVCGNKFKWIRNKRGFGITEVLVAAAVLGFLYMAVLNMNAGNHDALLRIRGRDGATEVAQNIIDSLGALGLANLSDENLKNAEGEVEYTKILPPITRTWEGQPGLVTNKMTVVYNAEVTVSPDADYTAKTTSLLLNTDSVAHVYAKRLDVKVSWLYKNSTQSITVSGVVK
ncbi:MAG: type II secretion system protein [Fibrobacter sp.]|nr:type II secretion system protein [Fibrobacter sp.]